MLAKTIKSKRNTISMQVLALGLASACFGAASVAKADSAVRVLPKMPIADCRGGRAKLYDECSSQLEIFDHAREVAAAEGKILLVSLGAEWCIWCHVFDAYIAGEHTRFTHTFSDSSDEVRYTETFYERPPANPSDEAHELSAFVSENFVLVHIEDRYSADGFYVLQVSGALEHHSGGLPFIYAVDNEGQYVSYFRSGEVETRRDTDDWFRGYDRTALLAELKRLKSEVSSR